VAARSSQSIEWSRNSRSRYRSTCCHYSRRRVAPRRSHFPFPWPLYLAFSRAPLIQPTSGLGTCPCTISLGVKRGANPSNRFGRLQRPRGLKPEWEAEGLESWWRLAGSTPFLMVRLPGLVARVVGPGRRSPCLGSCNVSLPAGPATGPEIGALKPVGRANANRRSVGSCDDRVSAATWADWLTEDYPRLILLDVQSINGFGVSSGEK
jgi:hypothetical protein